jgi:hypothetical protein
MGEWMYRSAILLADYQVIVENTADETQRVLYALNGTDMKCNLKFSMHETRTMAVKGKVNVRTKLTMNDDIIK